MNLDGASYALFGPYPDQCVTAPSTCTTGFTFALWIRKASTCSSNNVGIATTLVKNPSPTEGIWIQCQSNLNEIKYGVRIHPDSSSKEVMVLASGPDVWFYAPMVWSVGQPIVIYDNGQYASDGNWETGPGFATNVNTQRKLAFGLQYTDDTNPSTYGTAYIDGVRMFNRPLTAAEVQALYDTF